MRAQNILYASLVAAALALPLASVAHANVVIAIDKSTQQMTVSVDGTPLYDWKVSTGRPGYNTPSGTFRPNRMEVMHHSREYENAPMPHSIFFDLRGHAIHGFFDTPHLGMAVSHGCVRLLPAHAATLFGLVKAEGMANTKVVISGHIPMAAPTVARRQPPAPGYGERSFAPYRPAYAGQSGYGREPYGRGFAPAHGQAYGGRYRGPSYGQPYSGQPPYGRPYYGQPSYGRSYYGPPVYQQPMFAPPFLPF